MQNDITFYAKRRFAAKSFDPNRKIPAETVEKLKELLRYSPSSTNIQPWYFILASTEEGKKRIAKSTDEKYPFNTPHILNASHVLVFATRLDADEDFLLSILDQEDKDGRFANEAHKPLMHQARKTFLNMHKHDFKDAQHWMDKQVYLNLGQFLLGADTLGVDATPMEGIDTAALDAEFGLRELGYTSLVVVPLGYHVPDGDWNAPLPKSRLPLSATMAEI